ncbi:citryl-CoA lyase [Pseudoruegeria sp. HB172150]|uniref:citryl-CoA lyase n=1 Tax=Pseudoruegeria sp. HB172150 TaxID=2721164 RepID=UPI0015583366|nr:citryl-CoA lyase [Pseudoruegeria sp. HB172150]
MATTKIATADATSVTIRGKDLVGDLIGKVSFTELTYFLTTGRMPDAAQTRVLDACLVTLAEHGFTPGALVTRLLADSVPGQVQVAIAGGLMTVGEVFAGTMEGCAALLEAGVAEGGDPSDYCKRVVAEHRAVKKPVPGFGHGFHKPDDPRTEPLLTLAEDCGVAGKYIGMLRVLATEVDAQAGRHITINATGAIGALLLEIGVPANIARGMAVVSRSAGLLGHIIEESETRSAREIARLTKEAIPYRSDDQ